MEQIDLSSLGVNTGIVVAIIFGAEGIKMADPAGKLKRFYTLLPTLLSIIAGLLITNPFEIRQVLSNVFMYFGASTFAYLMYKKVLFPNQGQTP